MKEKKSVDMNISFGIGIPTINRWDLLSTSLHRYRYEFSGIDISIIDNGNQGISEAAPFTNVYVQDSNIGVAASWNKLCQIIFDKGNSHAVILNDDIYWGKNKLQVLELLNHHKDGFFLSEESFSVFIITKSTFDKVGLFDENFYPAYFEDADYCYRMKQAGIKIYKSLQLNPKVTRHSSSIDRDKRLLFNKGNNELYYIQKWGGKVGNEKYTKPFNTDKINNGILKL